MLLLPLLLWHSTLLDTGHICGVFDLFTSITRVVTFIHNRRRLLYHATGQLSFNHFLRPACWSAFVLQWPAIVHPQLLSCLCSSICLALLFACCIGPKPLPQTAINSLRSCCYCRLVFDLLFAFGSLPVDYTVRSPYCSAHSLRS